MSRIEIRERERENRRRRKRGEGRRYSHGREELDKQRSGSMVCSSHNRLSISMAGVEG